MTDRTALYRLFDTADELLYIGISRSLDQRWTSHARYRRWWHEVTRREIAWFETRSEAQAAEKRAIRIENPRYNTCHTDRHSRISNKKLTEAERRAWEWSRHQYGYSSPTRIRRR